MIIATSYVMYLQDYSSCGISGKVSKAVPRLASTFGRTIGGVRSSSSEWPWHAVISIRPRTTRNQPSRIVMDVRKLTHLFYFFLQKIKLIR